MRDETCAMWKQNTSILKDDIDLRTTMELLNQMRKQTYKLLN